MNPNQPFDPDAPFDPDMPFNPNAQFDPDMPFDPDMHPDPGMMAGWMMVDLPPPLPWELDPNFKPSPDGSFQPYFDPDNPLTWPDYPGFNPEDPATWPPEFFYDPFFDPNDPATWPDDPFFDPNNPATWPKPPLFDPDDPATWPDYPGFDPNDPDTWPPPDLGGPGDDLPPDSEFIVLGPQPIASAFWEWGKWVDGGGSLMFPDVFPINGTQLVKGFSPGDPYYELVNGTVRFTLETVTGINIAAAMVNDAGGTKLLTGSCNMFVEVGNGAGLWSGQFRIGDAIGQVNDFVRFDVPIGESEIDINGNLVLAPTAVLANLNYSSKINGNNYGPGTVTFYDVNGELLGNGGVFVPPVDAVIGWFKFEHGTMAIVKGTFASDLVVTGTVP